MQKHENASDLLIKRLTRRLIYQAPEHERLKIFVDSHVSRRAAQLREKEREKDPFIASEIIYTYIGRRVRYINPRNNRLT